MTGYMEILLISAIVGCISAFILLLVNKLGLIEMLQVHGNDIMSELASCDFCMSWWMCLVISLFVIVIDPTTGFFIPFIATPICRRLL